VIAAAPTRAERAREAQRLREQGLYHRQVAEAMGISRSYAAELLNDPTGDAARLRKDRARGRCVDCGEPTSWGGGGSRYPAPERCRACRAVFDRVRLLYWTQERCVEALQAFAAANGGRPPTPPEMAADPGLPHCSTLAARFGSVREAMRAAGLRPRRVGEKVAR
jgi:hypothetical protein